MTLTIDLSPEQEARLQRAAELEGAEPSALVMKWVDHLPGPLAEVGEDDPTIAYVMTAIANAPKTPDAIREAEEDLRDFMCNMNEPRKQAGGRLHYPEAECH